jgi:hypothetical protein
MRHKLFFHFNTNLLLLLLSHLPAVMQSLTGSALITACCILLAAAGPGPAAHCL